MRKYINFALVYAIIAMVCGVFYREFTKFYGYTDKTNLSTMHTHYFMLGMVFFILLLLLEKNFSFSSKKTDKAVLAYNIGLNITSVAFLARGILQVLQTQLSSALDASISGIAGIGHTILGISMIIILFGVKKSIK